MIAPLTSLRFVFAFMVFASHLHILKNAGDAAASALYASILHEGYVGVGFFFMLSGFILSHRYGRRVHSKKQFWLSRMARIYPLHLLTLLLAIPTAWPPNADWLGILGLQALLLHSFVPENSVYFSFNMLSWSISAEAFFYLLFPWLAGNLFKYRLWGWLFFMPALAFILPAHLQHALLYINPLSRLADFMGGMLLYHAFVRWKLPPKWGTAAELLALSCLALFLAMHQHIPQPYRYACFYWPPIAFVIWAFAQEQGAFSRLLSAKGSVHLGETAMGSICGSCFSCAILMR